MINATVKLKLNIKIDELQLKKHSMAKWQ